MTDELFKTNIGSRDPRYPQIVRYCNYFLGGIFLGMVLTLSGVMLTGYHEQNKSSRDKNPSNLLVAQVFGYALLAAGCIVLVLSLGMLLKAAFMYMRTTTSPPRSHTWDYLDNDRRTASTEMKVRSNH